MRLSRYDLMRLDTVPSCLVLATFVSHNVLPTHGDSWRATLDRIGLHVVFHTYSDLVENIHDAER